MGSAFAVLVAVKFRFGIVESLFTNDPYKYGTLFYAFGICRDEIREVAGDRSSEGVTGRL